MVRYLQGHQAQLRVDGRTYYYGVLPVGASSPACLGRMSNCASAVPLPPVDPCVPVELQTFEIE